MVRYWLFLLPAIAFVQVATAQVTASDYDRALKTRTRYDEATAWPQHTAKTENAAA